jgi:hypothetical protein
MCVSCVSNGEFVAMNAVLAAGAVARGVGALRVTDPDERRVARDMRTVAFLRALDLDPEEILGASVVAAADRRASSGTASPARPRLAGLYARVRCVAGAMRSQRLLSPQ